MMCDFSINRSIRKGRENGIILFFAFSLSALRVFASLPTFRLKAGGLKTESKMRVRESLYRPIPLSSETP
jgi:hypothetical protein